MSITVQLAHTGKWTICSQIHSDEMIICWKKFQIYTTVYERRKASTQSHTYLNAYIIQNSNEVAHMCIPISK